MQNRLYIQPLPQVGGDHYEKLEIQPWDFFEKNSNAIEISAACKQNILKYIMRDKNNKVEDLKKALWYLQAWINIYEKTE